MTAEHQTVLDATELARHYTMGENVVRAIDGIDLSIREGEFVMIVGTSGSGKSTLLHLLGCLDKPTSGSHSIKDRALSGMEDVQLSWLRNRHVGFVFQTFNLLNDLSVVENIALPLVYAGLGRQERLALARQYAQRVGLAERTDHRPTELSGGEAQRVAIARALVNEPDIILADEPTGNLDSTTSREIMDIFHDLHAAGYTIVMVTHDREFAKEGTRKITVADGRVTTDEPTGRSAASDCPDEQEARPRPARRRMSLLDLLRIGFREGLMAHKMRTMLTTLGIVIAVTGVIAMSSFSMGSKKKQADQIRELGANLVRVSDNRLEGEKLARTRIRGSRGLSLEDIATLRRVVPGVKYVAGVREIKMNVAGVRTRVSPRIIGVTCDYLDVNQLAVERGRFIDEHDQHHAARVAVLGHSVWQQLGTNSLGTSVLLGGTPYTIVGVLENRQVDLKGLEATGIEDPNYDLVIPLHTLLTRTKHIEIRSELDEIHLQLESEDMLYEAGTSVRRALKVRHGGEEDFQLVVPLDLLKQKQQAQRLLDILTICIASISLVVGGIGIMNIMLASVTERVREIGIRRTVGASKRDILYQFLSEAVLISVVGGIIGIALAMLAVMVTCSVLDLPVVISSWVVLLAVVASTATGLAFGFYPAVQAAAKEPVEALRYE